jgi:hypothetical protein
VVQLCFLASVVLISTIHSPTELTAVDYGMSENTKDMVGICFSLTGIYATLSGSRHISGI